MGRSFQRQGRSLQGEGISERGRGRSLSEKEISKLAERSRIASGGETRREVADGACHVRSDDSGTVALKRTRFVASTGVSRTTQMILSGTVSNSNEKVSTKECKQHAHAPLSARKTLNGHKMHHLLH